MKNKKSFIKYMATLAVIFDKELTDALAEVYWQVLEPFSDEDCDKAFQKVMATSRFWPKPADFLEVLQGTEEEKAVNAWIEVDRAMKRIGTYSSVTFKDHVIHSVIETMGGWISLGETCSSEWKWKQKEFERLYTFMEKRADHPGHLPGLIEIDNQARGFSIEPPVRIGFEERKQLEEG